MYLLKQENPTTKAHFENIKLSGKHKNIIIEQEAVNQIAHFLKEK